MFITPGQNKRLHCLLTDLKLMDMKADLILDATDGRTRHSSELLVNEATQLIKHLEGKTERGREGAMERLRDGETKREGNVPVAPMEGGIREVLNKLRKKIISLMIEMWAVNDDGKPDMHFIYWFSLNYIYKKKLNDLNEKELHKMISIVEAKWLPWYYKQKGTNIDFSITSLRVTIKN